MVFVKWWDNLEFEDVRGSWWRSIVGCNSRVTWWLKCLVNVVGDRLICCGLVSCWGFLVAVELDALLRSQITLWSRSQIVSCRRCRRRIVVQGLWSFHCNCWRWILKQVQYSQRENTALALHSKQRNKARRNESIKRIKNQEDFDFEVMFFTTKWWNNNQLQWDLSKIWLQ